MTIQKLCNLFGFRPTTTLGDVEVKINNRAGRRQQKRQRKQKKN